MTTLAPFSRPLRRSVAVAVVAILAMTACAETQEPTAESAAETPTSLAYVRDDDTGDTDDTKEADSPSRDSAAASTEEPGAPAPASDEPRAPAPDETPQRPAEDENVAEDAEDKPRVATQSSLPFEFTGVALHGGEDVDGLDLYFDRPTIMTFVVPSCPVCIAEAPMIADFAIRNPDITYVIVHGQGERADYLEFNARASLDQSNVIHLIDDGTLWRRFGVIQQPTSVLIQDDGSVTGSRGALTTEGLDLVAYYLRNEEPPASLHNTLSSPPPEQPDA